MITLMVKFCIVFPLCIIEAWCPCWCGLVNKGMADGFISLFLPQVVPIIALRILTVSLVIAVTCSEKVIKHNAKNLGLLIYMNYSVSNFTSFGHVKSEGRGYWFKI